MPLTRHSIALRTALVALALLMIFTFSTVRPVQAETSGQRSTRNIILGAVVLAAGIVLYNNYHRKQVAHNTIVGYTPDGGTVYADGRVVYPDGTVLYTSNDGRTPCSYDGYSVPCNRAVRVYNTASNDEDDRASYDQDDQNDQGDQRDRSATYYAPQRQVYNYNGDQRANYSYGYRRVKNGDRGYRGHGHHYGNSNRNGHDD